MITEITIILVLMILNGILSASEIAIVSSRKARLQSLSQKNAGAKTALKFKEGPHPVLFSHPDGFIFMCIFARFFSGGSISKFITPYISHIPGVAKYADHLSVGLVVLI